MTIDRDADESPLERLFTKDPAEEDRPALFAGEPSTGGPAGRLQGALTRLRRVRSQVGSDGLSPEATRTLLDEVVKALEALAEMKDRDR